VQVLRGGGPEENAERLKALLMGYGLAAETEVVALNTGALLLTAGLAADLRDGVAMALQALGSGEAYRRLDRSSRSHVAEGVLAEIVARKRIDVAARLADFGDARPSRPRRSLKAALARPGARFILEVKRGSPSGGAIRPGADAGALARAYRGAADAISVLTDAPYFGGSLDDLRAVRRDFLGPILAKDFIVDPRQVAEARRHGADAVLVILAILDDPEAAAVMAEARRLGMDVLVEAHDAVEVRRAVGSVPT
jgi:hypothetical protein